MRRFDLISTKLYQQMENDFDAQKTIRRFFILQCKCSIDRLVMMLASCTYSVTCTEKYVAIFFPEMTADAFLRPKWFIFFKGVDIAVKEAEK